MSILKSAKKKPSPSYSMAGRLYLGSGGWLMLSVPNAIVHGVFDSLEEPGVELPPSGDDGRLNAHVSVMRPDEIDEIGGPDVISERGHTFHYSLGRLKTVEPAGWADMSRVWMLEVKSPELEKLRKSYGLARVPKNGEYELHLTVAVRRKSVFRNTDIRKVANSLVLLGANW